jgi:hypothetical protein
MEALLRGLSAPPGGGGGRGQPNPMAAMMQNMGPMMQAMGAGRGGGSGNPMAAMMQNMGPMMQAMGGAGRGGGSGNPMADMMQNLGPMMAGLGRGAGGGAAGRGGAGGNPMADMMQNLMGGGGGGGGGGGEDGDPFAAMMGNVMKNMGPMLSSLQQMGRSQSAPASRAKKKPTKPPLQIGPIEESLAVVHAQLLCLVCSAAHDPAETPGPADGAPSLSLPLHQSAMPHTYRSTRTPGSPCFFPWLPSPSHAGSPTVPATTLAQMLTQRCRRSSRAEAGHAQAARVAVFGHGGATPDADGPRQPAAGAELPERCLVPRQGWAAGGGRGEPGCPAAASGNLCLSFPCPRWRLTPMVHHRLRCHSVRRWGPSPSPPTSPRHSWPERPEKKQPLARYRSRRRRLSLAPSGVVTPTTTSSSRRRKARSESCLLLLRRGRHRHRHPACCSSSRRLCAPCGPAVRPPPPACCAVLCCAVLACLPAYPVSRPHRV